MKFLSGRRDFQVNSNEKLLKVSLKPTSPCVGHRPAQLDAADEAPRAKDAPGSPPVSLEQPPCFASVGPVSSMNKERPLVKKKLSNLFKGHCAD
ncbi:hypothetical protein AWB78_04937 [Caballeronia calidae]|uniref:Uncharacterized protein n=1 Tax=Caballeronia calidae TaxID=1777139 RepID=A0A158DAA1_9BURK|nr:hypothetical protein AWB78_04937 [Caballeronia calidae]